jgi:hypothetical protein
VRWWEKLLGIKPVQYGDSSELEEARRKGEEARHKLAETLRLDEEVSAVSMAARKLRQENHFSASIAAAFRRTHG